MVKNDKHQQCSRLFALYLLVSGMELGLGWKLLKAGEYILGLSSRFWCTLGDEFMLER